MFPAARFALGIRSFFVLTPFPTLVQSSGRIIASMSTYMVKSLSLLYNVDTDKSEALPHLVVDLAYASNHPL
jgi:hypothetical protein